MATRAKDARGGKGAHRKSFSSGYRWWGYWPPFSPLPDEVYGPASMGGRVTSLVDIHLVDQLLGPLTMKTSSPFEKLSTPDFSICSIAISPLDVWRRPTRSER